MLSMGAYMAEDPDTGDDSGNPITWSVSGADGGKFNIPAGMLTFKLTFKARPDFEKPGDANTDNVYEVTVGAADSMDLGNRDTMDVKVMVENENEPGVVTLSRTQPRVGVPVTASLTDPDGSISGLRWQWYRADTSHRQPRDALARDRLCADATSDSCLIKGDSGQTPTRRRDGDVGEILNASGVLHRR